MIANLEVIINEIAFILKSEKKLQVISECINQEINLGFALCIHVEDENKKQFSLLINHNSNQKDLHGAKIKSKYLKSLSHPNIIQYVDDFTIGDYYFIQIERIFLSLFNWFNKKTINQYIRELHYVEIALSMLDATFYLNKNKCSLPLQFTLHCFAFDEKMNVKLIHFVTPQEISISRVKSTFIQCREMNELFYYKKDILSMDNKWKIWQTIDIDIWAIGICLYYLSGASIQHILNFIQEQQQSYSFSECLGFQNNVILFNFLCPFKKLLNLPSITRLIGALQIEQKNLLQKGKQIEKCFADQNSCQNYNNKMNEEKEDFQIYLNLQNKLFDDQVEANKVELIKQLMIKYGESSLLLQMLTKSFIVLGDLEEAIMTCSQIINSTPFCDLAYYNLGKISEIKGDFEESIRFYEKSLIINPLHSYTFQSLVTSYRDLGFGSPIEYLKQCAESNLNNEYAYYHFGQYYEQKEQRIQSIQALKKGIRIQNKDISFFECLSNQYIEITSLEKALLAQQQVIDLCESDLALNVLEYIKSSL